MFQDVSGGFRPVCLLSSGSWDHNEPHFWPLLGSPQFLPSHKDRGILEGPWTQGPRVEISVGGPQDGLWGNYALSSSHLTLKLGN